MKAVLKHSSNGEFAPTKKMLDALGRNHPSFVFDKDRTNPKVIEVVEEMIKYIYEIGSNECDFDIVEFPDEATEFGISIDETAIEHLWYVLDGKLFRYPRICKYYTCEEIKDKVCSLVSELKVRYKTENMNLGDMLSKAYWEDHLISSVAFDDALYLFEDELEEEAAKALLEKLKKIYSYSNETIT